MIICVCFGCVLVFCIVLSVGSGFSVRWCSRLLISLWSCLSVFVIRWLF